MSLKGRKATARVATAATAASAAALLLASTVGATTAQAAPVPTISVTSAGDADWQITYHRGSLTHRESTCRVWLDDRIVASPEPTSVPKHSELQDAKKQDAKKQGAKKSAPPMLNSTTLHGAKVAPGAHRVNVRCGPSVSPTVWLIAPRNQIFDGITWLSNGTAGLIGY